MSPLNRPAQKRRPQWLIPSLGSAAGLAYALADYLADETALTHLPQFSTPWILTIVRDFLDFIFPVLVGLLIGLGINLWRRQARLYEEVSIKNAQFQRDLLVENLISLFLHEIRNPIHNITAALEESRSFLPPELNEIVERNLKRFDQLTSQYKRRHSLFETIEPREPVELRSWVENFVEDKVRAQLSELNVNYFQEIDPLLINMHPILLERAFNALFSNACEDLKKSSNGSRKLTLLARVHEPDSKQVKGPRSMLSIAPLCVARPLARGLEPRASTAAEGSRASPGPQPTVEIKLMNTSEGFPEEVLEKQGHAPVVSRKGLGLGLTFLRKMVERVGGDLLLSNSAGQAEVTLLVPGGRS